MPREEMSRRFPEAQTSVLDALRMMDTSIVNVDLIVQILRKFVTRGSKDDDDGEGGGDDDDEKDGGGRSSGDDGSSDDGSSLPLGGSVLIFLPGTTEIEDVQRAVIGMLASSIGRVRRDWVLPLHG